MVREFLISKNRPCLIAFLKNPKYFHAESKMSNFESTWYISENSFIRNLVRLGLKVDQKFAKSKVGFWLASVKIRPDKGGVV